MRPRLTCCRGGAAFICAFKRLAQGGLQLFEEGTECGSARCDVAAVVAERGHGATGSNVMSQIVVDLFHGCPASAVHDILAYGFHGTPCAQSTPGFE